MRTRSKTLAARLRHRLAAPAAPVPAARRRLADRRGADAAPAFCGVPAGGDRPADHPDRHGGGLRQLAAASTTRSAPPTAARRASCASRAAARAAASAGGQVVLRLAYRPPYDWEHMRDFSRRAPSAASSASMRDGYARTLACPGGHALVRSGAAGRRCARAARAGAPAATLLQLSSAARRVFDLAADPRASASSSPPTAHRAAGAQRPGLRIPGAWDAFECAVRACSDSR